MKLNINPIKASLLTCLGILPFAFGYAQTVTPNQTAAALANALVGPGVSVSNASLTCPSNANGTFSGGTGNLQISNGILLTSGSAANVSNPAVFFESTNNGAGGDANLTALSGNATFDACVLEFDFIPLGDSISFRYQFGSEEYPNFTCTQFNDVFGFFISGPGYAVPTNIAKVPGTNIPVAINSINGGSPTGAGVLANCTAMGPGSPFSSLFLNNVGSLTNAYDGYTTVLAAKAAVTPCSTYHFKLGVADASDRILSSGVYLQESSLSILPPVIVGCPSNMTVNATTCTAGPGNWTPPTVAGNCLNVTSSSNYLPTDPLPLGTTTIVYTFTNAGGTSTCSFDVTVVNVVPTCSITAVPSNAVYTGGIPTNIYLGYGPQSATLDLTPSGGTTFTYAWAGPAGLSCTNCQDPVFTPTAPGTYVYTATVTNEYGCSTTCSITFCVKDIRVPGFNNKVYVCHVPEEDPTNIQTLSISVNAVPTHIGIHAGDVLGQCGQGCGDAVPNARMILAGSQSTTSQTLAINAYPNPFNDGLRVKIESNTYESADLTITDLTGRKLETKLNQPVGQEIVIGQKLAPGVYMVQVTNGNQSQQIKVTKLQ